MDRGTIGQRQRARGLLLLGEKTDGSLYQEEEIGLARAAAERLLEMRATAELAHRLIAVQRSRLTEDQVLDRRTRQLLHDEVLPRIHTAILATSDKRTASDLGELHHLVSDLLHRLQPSLAAGSARQGLVAALRDLVDCRVSELAGEVAYGAARELVRNASRHGRGNGANRPLHLDVTVRVRGDLEIVVGDDGVGFVPAFAEERRGNGLALHSAMMAIIGSSLEIESVPGLHTRALISVPIPSGLP